jgi:LmbE family N-acetylglucosaminyl deacetylase
MWFNKSLKNHQRRTPLDPARGPLVPWLKDQVKSVIDALANAAVRRHETQAAEGDNVEEFR